METSPDLGHIVALGGGGFSEETDNSLIDDFILALSRRQPARLCFVPTASADSAQYLVKFYRAFSGRAAVADLTLFDSPSLPRRPARTSDCAQYLMDHDIIYVGGGNTANLLAMWRRHGLDTAMRRAWEAGAVLCGVSAGMLCWFRGGVTDSFGGLEAFEDGLDFINASACPHYSSEPARRPIYHELIGQGFPPGYAADDGVAMHFQGNDLVEAVSSRPDAYAYRVGLRDGRVVESHLDTRYLGAVPS
jgi:dipeptidase E